MIVKTDHSDNKPRDESFLGRWSRRKRAEPEKREVEDAAVADDVERKHLAAAPASAAPPADTLSAPADLPAIDDLTPESDFGRFMKPDVPIAARNAAMKKLFADPHFNVMDGLDTYIDDYTKADPIPEAMLRSLAQSRMLKLFNYDKEDAEDAEKERFAKASLAEGPVIDDAALPAQVDAGATVLTASAASYAPTDTSAKPDDALDSYDVSALTKPVK